MGTVARLLADRVSFRCASVDRVLLAGYIPQMQYEGGVVRFLLNRGFPIPSPVGLARNHDRLVAEYEALVAVQGLEVVRFTKGVSKEEVARPFLARARTEGRTGIVLAAKAQERVAAWRGFKDTAWSTHGASHPHFSYRRQSLFVDHWYFYVADEAWGPTFIKTCPYAPYPVWVWCNGHEWAKCQLEAADVAFEALDNGLRAVADPAAAHRICARLGAGHVRALLERLTAALPSPLVPTDGAAGFAYDWSVRQLEVSDTAVFDRPQVGRAWFEAAIRDHLDLGRPERVSVVVNRRVVTRGPAKTPGMFATRVITPDVDPHLQVHYKASKVKAYFKEQRALRVETTINDPGDFGVGRRLTTDNWRALRRAGAQTNERFLAALGEGEPAPPDATTLAEVVLPSIHDGLRAPGLRFGDPRVMALLASIASFSHVVGGLTNAGLCRLMAGLYHPDYGPRRATYDLRRLRRKGFIERVPSTNTYRLTPHGRRIACLFTKVGARVVIPTLSALEAEPRPRGPAPPLVVTTWRAYERELETLLKHAAA